MGCGSTGAALDRVADWLVPTMEDEPWLAGVVGTGARLDFFRGGSPPAAVATALAEKLGRWVERFGGILSLQKNNEKRTRYYPEQYFDSENRKINRTSHGKTKRIGKESMSNKQSTQQLPCNAKIQCKWTTTMETSIL